MRDLETFFFLQAFSGLRCSTFQKGESVFTQGNQGWIPHVLILQKLA